MLVQLRSTCRIRRVYLHCYISQGINNPEDCEGSFWLSTIRHPSERRLNEWCLPIPCGFLSRTAAGRCCVWVKKKVCRDGVPSNDLLIMNNMHLLTWNQCIEKQNMFPFIISLFCKLQQRCHVFINIYSHTHTPTNITKSKEKIKEAMKQHMVRLESNVQGTEGYKSKAPGKQLLGK